MAEEIPEGTVGIVEVEGLAPEHRIHGEPGEDERTKYEAAINELGKALKTSLEKTDLSDGEIDQRVIEAQDKWRMIPGAPWDLEFGETVTRSKGVIPSRLIPFDIPNAPGEELEKATEENKAITAKARETGEYFKAAKDIFLGTAEAIRTEIEEGEEPKTVEFAEGLTKTGAVIGGLAGLVSPIPGGLLIGTMVGAGGGLAVAHEIDDPGFIADLYNRVLDVSELPRYENWKEELTADALAKFVSGSSFIAKQKMVKLDGKTPEEADAEINEWTKNYRENHRKAWEAHRELRETDPEAFSLINNIYAAGIPLARQIEQIESLPPVRLYADDKGPGEVFELVQASPGVKSMAQIYREWAESGYEYIERLGDTVFMSPEEREDFYQGRRERISEDKYSDAWTSVIGLVEEIKRDPQKADALMGQLSYRLGHLSYMDLPWELRVVAPDVRHFLQKLQEATPRQRQEYQARAEVDPSFRNAMNEAYGTENWSWFKDTTLDVVERLGPEEERDPERDKRIAEDVDVSEVQYWLSRSMFSSLTQMSSKFGESIPDSESALAAAEKSIERRGEAGVVYEESVSSFMNNVERDGNRSYLVESTLSQTLRMADTLMQPMVELAMNVPLGIGAPSIYQMTGVKERNEEMTLDSLFTESMAAVATGDSGAQMAVRRAMLANGGRPGEGYWGALMAGGLLSDFIVPWEAPWFRSAGFTARRSAQAYRGSRAAVEAVRVLEGAPVLTERLPVAVEMIAAYTAPEIYQRIPRKPPKGAVPGKPKDVDAVSAIKTVHQVLAEKLVARGIDPLEAMSRFRREEILDVWRRIGVENPEKLWKVYNKAMKGRRAIYTDSLQRFLTHGTPAEMSMRQDPEYRRIAGELNEMVRAGYMTDQEVIFQLSMFEHQAFAHAMDPMVRDIVSPIDMFKQMRFRVGAEALEPGARVRYQKADEVDAAAAGAKTADEVAEARRAWEEEGVESPFFKIWFGDDGPKGPKSAVVDEAGEPLAVYHGTPGGRFSESARETNIERRRVAAERQRLTDEIDAKESSRSLLLEKIKTLDKAAGEAREQAIKESRDPEGKRHFWTNYPVWKNAFRPLEEARQEFSKLKSEIKSIENTRRNLPLYRDEDLPEEEVFRTRSGGKTDWGYRSSGAYFTADPEVAKGYAQQLGTQTPYVYKVYLSLKNPFIEGVTEAPPGMLEEIADLIELEAKRLRASYGRGWDSMDAMTKERPKIKRRVLEKYGFDGEIWTHRQGVEYIAFDPRQIKSADNIGTFDPGDPRIRYQMPEGVEPPARVEGAAATAHQVTKGEWQKSIDREEIGPKVANTRRWVAAIADEFDDLPSAMRMYGQDFAYEIPDLVRRLSGIGPDEKIKIYRAISADDPAGGILPGDWVALDRSYAELHGSSGYGDVGSKIVEIEVSAKEIIWAGTSADEWHYAPMYARDNTIKTAHEAFVKDAIRDGKAVPEEVLKDYPHLAKEPPARAEAPEPPARVEVLGQPVEAVTEVEGVSYRSRADRAREMREEITEMGHDVEELMRQDSGTLAGFQDIEPRVVNIDDIPVQKLREHTGRIKKATEFIESGEVLSPPRIALNSDGTFNSIMDGRHRLEALRAMGKKKIVVDVELMEPPARFEGAREPLPSPAPEVEVVQPKRRSFAEDEAAERVHNYIQGTWLENKASDFPRVSQLIYDATYQGNKFALQGLETEFVNLVNQGISKLRDAREQAEFISDTKAGRELLSDINALLRDDLEGVLNVDPWDLSDALEDAVKKAKRAKLDGYYVSLLRDIKSQFTLIEDLHGIFQSEDWTTVRRGIQRKYQGGYPKNPYGPDLAGAIDSMAATVQELRSRQMQSKLTTAESNLIQRESGTFVGIFDSPSEFSKFMKLGDKELSEADSKAYDRIRSLLSEEIKTFEGQILPTVETFRQIAEGFISRLDLGDMVTDEKAFIDDLFREFVETDDAIDWKAVYARFIPERGRMDEDTPEAMRRADASDASRAIERYNRIWRGFDPRVFWNGRYMPTEEAISRPEPLVAKDNSAFSLEARKWTTGKEAIRWLAENGTTDPDHGEIRSIARYVEEFVPEDVSIRVSDFAHPDVAGQYHHRVPASGTRITFRIPSSPSIDLFHPDSRLRSGTWERDALHELNHAATIERYELGKSEAPGSSLRQAADELDKLFNFVKQRIEADVARKERRPTLGRELDYLAELDLVPPQVVREFPYGLANVYEFLAEAFSNPRFQSILKDIEVDSKTNKSAWSQLMSWMREVLGVSKADTNAFAEVMRIQDELLTKPSGAEEIPGVARFAEVREPLPSKAPVPPKITRNLAEHEGAKFTDEDVEAFLDSKQAPIVPIGKKALAKYAKMPKSEREALPEQERRRIREAFRIKVLAGVPEPMAIKTRFKPRDSVKEKALPSNPTRRTNDVLEKVDALLERWPEGKMLSSEAEWKKFWFNATNDKNVVKPPYKMIEYYNNPDLVVDFLKKNLTAEQKKAVDEGFSVVEKFGEAYATGRAQPRHTAKLFLWGMLSRNTSVWVQEAAFIDAVNAGVDEFINVALRGEWDDAWQSAWRKRARAIVNINKYSGSPGTQALINLNSFGDLFLRRMSERLSTNHERYPGMTKLEAMHRLMSDQNLSGSEVRRQFWTMSQGSGIQNKVMSFVALMAGRPDTAVLDVWQTRHIYDYANRANEYGNPGSLNTGWQAPKGGYKSTASFRPWSQKPGLSSVFDGPRGLLFYEAVEGALSKIVPEVYKKLGRPEDASIGRFHWETWVAANQQLISHSTGAALVKEMFGLESPYRGVYVRMGEQRSKILGFYYVNVPTPDLHPLDPVMGSGVLATATSDGRIFAFDLNSRKKFESEIGSHAEDVLKKLPPEERILPQKPEGESTGKYLARLSQEAGGSWYDHPSVNRAAYDRAIERFGVQPDDPVLDVLADAFRIAPTEARKGLPEPIRYAGEPDSPRGSFEIRAGLSGTASYLIRLFSTGRFDTLLHENGHLLEAIMGDKWRAWLWRFFSVDQYGNLTEGPNGGHEQLANALAQWMNTKRPSSNPGVNRLLGHLHFELRNLWRLIRQKRHRLPNAMVDHWDSYYKPDDLLGLPAAKITDDILKRIKQPPVVQLRRSIAGRVSKSIRQDIANRLSGIEPLSILKPENIQSIASEIADIAIKRLGDDPKFEGELPRDIVDLLITNIVDDISKRLQAFPNIESARSVELLQRRMAERVQDISGEITSDIFARLRDIPAEILPTAAAERVAESPVGRTGRRRESMRLLGDQEYLRQEFGLKEGDEIDLQTLVIRSIGFESAERFRKNQRAENMIQLTIRTIVPASRLSRIQKDVTDRLMNVVGEAPKKMAERVKSTNREDASALVAMYMREDPDARLWDRTDYIEFDPAQAARLKRMVHELANEPMGNILPDRLFHPEADYTRMSVADYDNIHEVLIDTSAGSSARVNRYSDRMSRSLALAFTRYIGEFLDRADNKSIFQAVDQVRAKLKKAFVVPQFAKDLLDPVVRDVVKNSLRLAEDNPRWFVRLAVEWRKGNKDGALGELYHHLIEQLNPPVKLLEVKPLLQLEKDLSGVIGREDARIEAMRKLDIDINEIDEGFDLRRLVEKIDDVQGYLTEYWGLHPKDRQALDIFRTYIDPTQPDRLVELSQGDKYAVSDAIRVIHNGLLRRKKQILMRAEKLTMSLAGSDDVKILNNVEEFDLVKIYRNFYEGNFLAMFEFIQYKGLITGGWEYDPGTAILEMIMRMRFHEIMGVLSHNLAKYGYSGDVRELTSHRGFGPDTSIDRIAFVENVHHYINQILSFNSQAINRPEKRALQTPRPKPKRQPDWRQTTIANADDLEAYTVAHEYVQKWGIKYAKQGFKEFTFPDGSTALLPEVVIREIEDSIERLSQIGYAWTGAKSRKVQTALASTRARLTKTNRLGLSLGPEFIPEKLDVVEMAKLSLGQAFDTAWELNPLTLPRLKQGLTTGNHIPILPYFMAAFTGIAAAVHQGLGFLKAAEITAKAVPSGAKMTASILTNQSNLVGAVVSRMWSQGGWSPDAPPLITKDYRVYTADRLGRMAIGHALKSSFVQAETVRSVSEILREKVFPEGAARVLKKPRAWREFLMEFATAMDNYFRVSVWISEIDRGVHPDIAAGTARRIGMDYSALTDWEKAWMRTIFLFYSFMRKNTDLFYDTIMTNPGRILAQMRLMRGTKNFWLDEEPELVERDYAQSRPMVYARKSILNIMKYKQVAWYAPELPGITAMKPFLNMYDMVAYSGSERGKDAMRDMVSMTNPIWQAPFINIVERDFYFGRGLRQMNTVPSWLVVGDRYFTGGLLVDGAFDVQVAKPGDPEYRTVPGETVVYRANNPRVWYAWKNVIPLPFAGREISIFDRADRANLGPVEFGVELGYQYRQFGIREGFLDSVDSHSFPRERMQRVPGTAEYVPVLPGTVGAQTMAPRTELVPPGGAAAFAPGEAAGVIGIVPSMIGRDDASIQRWLRSNLRKIEAETARLKKDLPQ